MLIIFELLTKHCISLPFYFEDKLKDKLVKEEGKKSSLIFFLYILNKYFSLICIFKIILFAIFTSFLFVVERCARFVTVDFLLDHSWFVFVLLANYNFVIYNI